MTAYNKGASAAKARQPFTDNPYHRNTPEWHEWNMGYLDNEGAG